MPRRKAETLTDAELPGLEDLDQDPTPAAAKPRRGRPPGSRTTTGTGNRGRIPARTANGRIMTKAQMQAKVSVELYTYLSLFAATWEMRDPTCAAVLYEPVTIPGPSGPTQVERLQGIVDRLVVIISRNDTVLRTMAESGILGEIAVLGHLVFPLGKALFAAHGPNGTGHRPVEEVTSDYAAQYPAYSG